MAWLRIDDKVRTHPKIAQAGPAAAWLWFCGVCYCREHLTDGFIPKSVVGSLAMNLPQPMKHAGRLVDVSLWHEAQGGYFVHDFLDWNPSRAEVEATRKADLERKRKPHGFQTESEKNPNGFQTTPSRARAGDAGLGSSEGSGSGSSFSEGSVRETISDGRGEWFWQQWRAAVADETGINPPLSPPVAAGRLLLEVLELVANLGDSEVLTAIRKFHALTGEAAARLNVKAKSLGYFKMALPRLLEAEKPELTQKDLERATEYRRRVGGCRHDPPHEDWRDCVREIAFALKVSA